MTLLNALKSSTKKARPIAHAKVAFFAISDGGDIAFLSEMTLEELVPLLDQWCKYQRSLQDRTVH